MSEIPVRPAAHRGSAHRRYLTVLFSDLSDSMTFAGGMEAEQFAAMLDGVRQVWRAVLPRHGGTIVRMQGDGVLAIFGYPEAGEDDGRRATDAALELHREVRDLRPINAPAGLPPLSLHSGIHAGLVLFDDGDIMHGRFELLGAVPNIAARLSDAAARDEILVSEETLGPETHFFRSDDARRIAVTGREGHITAYRILARSKIGTRFEASKQRGLVPFVGRGRELDALSRALRAAFAGAPRLVAITAPAGLGKTRVTDEFLRRAATGCRILRGYCTADLSAEPLQPFLQMLRALFDVATLADAADAGGPLEAQLRAIDPALVVHRAELLALLALDRAAAGADSSTQAQRTATREATVTALVELFRALAAQMPLVLFIDDWQWSDDASSQVLNAIRMVSSRALLVVFATRELAPGDPSADGTQILELDPFTETESDATIQRLLPGADPFVINEIHRYSGGNPLFIEELCHLAAHQRSAQLLRQIRGGAAWLNALIESRVGRLSDGLRELVRTAAVIGTVFPAWLLESVTGCDADHPSVRQLAEADFVFPGELPGTLRFKHGITRDVIYDLVGLYERRALHLRIAEALRARGASDAHDEALEALAYHYGAAGNGAEAARCAELAGDKAVKASALDRAKAQYRAALAALDLLPPSRELSLRWIDIAQRLGPVCVFDPSRDELPIFRRALELAHQTDDPAWIARGQYWLGYFSYALGETRDAIRFLGLGLATASAIGDVPLAWQIRASLGQALAAAAEYDGALDHLERAIAIKTRHRSGTRTSVGLAYSLACKGWVFGDRGDFDTARACFEQALETVHGPNHEVEASIRGSYAAVLLWQGSWETAQEAASESVRIGAKVRCLFSFAMCHAAGAYAAWMLTDDPSELNAAIEATSWLEPRQSWLFRSLNYGWIAEGLFSIGRAQEARLYAARALARGRESDLMGGAMAYRALARAAAAGGDPARAQRYLGLALRIAQRRQSAHELAVTRLADAEISIAADDRARARQLLDAALPEFGRMKMRWHLTRARTLSSA